MWHGVTEPYENSWAVMMYEQLGRAEKCQADC